MVPTSTSRLQPADRPLADILEPHIAQRLAAEGIVTDRDWLQLSHRKRRLIFGITISHVRLIDRITSTTTTGVTHVR